MKNDSTKENAVHALRRIFAAAREIVEAERSLIEKQQISETPEVENREDNHA